MNNTSERYRYIFGSTLEKEARTADRFEAESASPVRPIDPQKESQKGPVVHKPVKQQKMALAFDLRYTMLVIVALVICTLGICTYVQKTIYVNNLNKQIRTLTIQREKLNDKQIALKAEIDNATNMDEIREYAENTLHMVYPSSDQILYYHGDPSDYFHQYESVDKE